MESKSSWLGFPRQIAFIVGNEACERFSYYGMRSILVIFMTNYLLLSQSHSVSVYHLFMTANYFLPLFGGYLSDRYLGKYRTILYLSLVYCLGHGVLALFESEQGLYWGLGLIALGSGGIKPCVSAFVGDQFTSKNQHLVNKVYNLFYFSINFGSFFSSLLIPWTLPRFGPGVSFGIPGVLMAIATLIFWMGRKHYIMVPPTGAENQSHFWGVLLYSLTHRKEKGKAWLDTARRKYDAHRVEGAKAVMGIAAVFASIIVFWALYDQTGSSWVLQAEQMDRRVFGVVLEAAQIQAINPILVMILIPLFSFGLYPMVERMGVRVTPLRKMGAGMFLTTLSFIMVAVIQVYLDRGVSVNVAWQFLPFLVVTMAEVLVSITGLEFAYTQAPPSMKSTIMSFWLLTVALGNFLTAIVAGLNPFDSGAGTFFFYAALVFAVSILFVAMAVRYQDRNYIGEGVNI